MDLMRLHSRDAALKVVHPLQNFIAGLKRGAKLLRRLFARRFLPYVFSITMVLFAKQRTKTKAILFKRSF